MFSVTHLPHPPQRCSIDFDIDGCTLFLNGFQRKCLLRWKSQNYTKNCFVLRDCARRSGRAPNAQAPRISKNKNIIQPNTGASPCHNPSFPAPKVTVVTPLGKQNGFPIHYSRDCGDSPRLRGVPLVHRARALPQNQQQLRRRVPRPAAGPDLTRTRIT
jgi:hypothetical protein